MPGVGKSTCGRILAQLLAASFVDLDEEFERRWGISPARAIEEKGEKWFRAGEAKLLREVLEGERLVVSCGGGALVREPWLSRALEHGIVVYLEASPRAIAARLGDSSRHPLLSASDDPSYMFKAGRRQPVAGAVLEARLAQMLAVRRSFYERAHLTVNVERYKPLKAALAIRAGLEHLGIKGYHYKGQPPKFERVEHGWHAWLDLGDRLHKVCVSDRPGLEGLKNGLEEAAGDAFRVVMVDDAVASRYKRELERESEVASSRWIVVKGGEEAKGLECLGGYVEALLEAGADRNSVVIAVGGGALLDAAGFVASVYMRGVPAFYVPTTFLAAVDAGVGGKTAMNLPIAKNVVGTFTQPVGVFIPIDVVWNEVKERGGVDGAAELVKVCLLMGMKEEEIVAFVGKRGRVRKHRLAAAVMTAVEYKMNVVWEDERDETGRRMVLNLGHTMAHLVESAARFEVPHGRAVGWGLVAMARGSVRRGLARAEFAAMVERVCRKYKLWPPPRVALDGARLRRPLFDKKGDRGKATLVLMRREGAAVLVEESEEEAKKLLLESGEVMIYDGGEERP